MKFGRGGRAAGTLFKLVARVLRTGFGRQPSECLGFGGKYFRIHSGVSRQSDPELIRVNHMDGDDQHGPDATARRRRPFTREEITLGQRG